MSKLEQIEKSIEALSDAEIRQPATWFDEPRWQRWDRQLVHDVATGKLDALVEEAWADHRAGKTAPL
jgi:hypothetical protein